VRAPCPSQILRYFDARDRRTSTLRRQLPALLCWASFTPGVCTHARIGHTARYDSGLRVPGSNRISSAGCPILISPRSFGAANSAAEEPRPSVSKALGQRTFPACRPSAAKYLHRAFTTHSPHLGFAALHTSWPCRFSSR
jgi:hypothetical protein